MKNTIDTTLTLTDCLAALTKDELHEIRRSQRINNASALNKMDLVQCIYSHLMVNMESQLYKFDVQRNSFIMRFLKHGGMLAYEDLDLEEKLNRNYYTFRGFIFPNKDWLQMPQEVQEMLAQIDMNTLQCKLARNTEWIKLTEGLLFYYGMIDIRSLREKIGKYMNGFVDLSDYYDVISDYEQYNRGVVSNGFGYNYYMVEDVVRILMEHQARPLLDYYPLTKAQVLQAADDEFVDRHEAYKQFVHFLMEHDFDEEDADMLVEELVLRIQEGDGPSELLEIMKPQLEFNDLAHVQKMMNLLIDMSNHTRQWILKGHTPEELFAEEKKHLLPLPKEQFKRSADNVYSLQTKQKVGRNDPCPCGSGMKYKKCCLE